MRVLALIAHPDDESFFAGGTLAQHAAQGDAVSIAVLSDGEASRFTRPNTAACRALVERRRTAFEHACWRLGVTQQTWRPTFPDQQADTVSQLFINRVAETLVAWARPELVYTHHLGDLNLDHRRVGEAVLVATRGGAPIRCMSPEWPGRCVGVPFVPTLYVLLTAETRAAKLAACLSYAGEVRPYPHPRSAQAIGEQVSEPFLEIA